MRIEPDSQGSRLRWFVVVLYAIAMAWVEAAVVLYLRTLTNRLDPYQRGPLPLFDVLTPAEMIREAATMVMLADVGWLAGRNLRTRLAYFLIAFGVWDICYYVFLRPLTGWPRSMFDWDVLFLLPLPWWGPVAAPMSIAALMILWGTLATQWERPGRLRRSDWKVWAINVAGGMLALYVFMADALGVVGQGAEAVRNVLPVQFNWLLFGFAWLLLAAPVLDLARQILADRRGPLAEPQPI
jgi:hypothetical protein